MSQPTPRNRLLRIFAGLRLLVSERRVSAIFTEILRISTSNVSFFNRMVEDLETLTMPAQTFLNGRDRIWRTRLDMNIALTGYNMDQIAEMLRIYYTIMNLLLEPHANDNRRGMSIRTNYGNNAGGFYSNFQEDSLQAFIDKLTGVANRYDELDHLIITGFELTCINIPLTYTRGSVGAPKSIQQASNKWLLVETKAKFNCFWNALATCKNWSRSNSTLLTDDSKRIKAGGELKRLAKCEGTRGANEEEYQKAANYCKNPIQFVNHLFQDQDDQLYNPVPALIANKEPYRILIRDNHAMALISRKAVEARFPDTDFMEVEDEVVEEIGTVQTPQKRRRVSSMGERSLVLLSSGEAAIGSEKFDSIEDAQFAMAERGLKLKEFAEVTEPKLVNMDKAIQEVEYLHRKVAAIDLETCGQKSNRFAIHKSYATGFAYCNTKGQNLYEDFWSYGSSIKLFAEWLHKHRRSFDGYIFVAHNGARFDYPIMLGEYFYYDKSKWMITDQLETNGQILSFTISSVEKDCSIKFLDTAKIVPQSLDSLTKMLDVKHKKMTDTVEHHKILDINWETFKPDVVEYLRNDCLGLLESYQKLAQALFDDSAMDITKYVTGASIAVNTLYKRFYNREKYPMYTLPPHFDFYIRETGYLGGRTEAFFIGKANGRVQYYDVNSMYPWAGTQLLPYGEPIRYDKKEFNRKFVRDGKLLDSFFGYVHVKITSTNLENNYIDDTNSKNRKIRKKRFIQLHGVKYRTSSGVQRLIFPKFEDSKEVICLFSEEVKYSQENEFPYEYEFESGMQFEKGYCRKKFYNHHYNLRKEVKKSNPAQAEILKLKMNSTYGRESMNTKNKDSIKIYNKGHADYYNDYRTDKLINITDKGDYTLVRRKTDIGANKINIAVGAAITSYSRMKLHKVLMSVIKAGGDPLYTDTDSIIALFTAEGTPVWKEWNGDDVEGKNLGSMKNEFDEKFEKAVSKCTAEEKEEAQKIIDRDGKGFDQVIIAGAKMYFLQRKLTDKVNVTTHAFKGLTKSYKLKFEDFEKMRRGEEFHPFEVLDDETPKVEHDVELENYVSNQGLRQRFVAKLPPGQISFVSGKRALMTNTQEEAGVQIVYVSKSFRMIYTKGTYEVDDYVQPLTINYGNPLKRTRQEFEEEEIDYE